MANKYGHKVLRLPPYHCMFNAIEHIWEIAKSHNNRHIGRDGNTKIACLNMWKESLDTVTPKVWKNSVRHTEKEIRKWYEREHIVDQLNVQPIIIDLSNFESNLDS